MGGEVKSRQTSGEGLGLILPITSVTATYAPHTPDCVRYKFAHAQVHPINQTTLMLRGLPHHDAPRILCRVYDGDLGRPTGKRRLCNRASAPRLLQSKTFHPVTSLFLPSIHLPFNPKLHIRPSDIGLTHNPGKPSVQLSTLATVYNCEPRCIPP